MQTYYAHELHPGMLVINGNGDARTLVAIEPPEAGDNHPMWTLHWDNDTVTVDYFARTDLIHAGEGPERGYFYHRGWHARDNQQPAPPILDPAVQAAIAPYHVGEGAATIMRAWTRGYADRAQELTEAAMNGQRPETPR